MIIPEDSWAYRFGVCVKCGAMSDDWIVWHGGYNGDGTLIGTCVCRKCCDDCGKRWREATRIAPVSAPIRDLHVLEPWEELHVRGRFTDSARNAFSD